MKPRYLIMLPYYFNRFFTFGRLPRWNNGITKEVDTVLIITEESAMISKRKQFQRSSFHSSFQFMLRECIFSLLISKVINLTYTSCDIIIIARCLLGDLGEN